MATLNELDRRAVQAYAASDLVTRTHVRVRAATCPFDRLDSMVPSTGRVLDVGCGHGLGSIRLALAAPGRRVLGVDIDPAKLDLARRAAAAAGVDRQVRFELVDEHWHPPPGEFESVVCVDVLYLLPAERRQALLDACAAALVPGGRLVLKEMSLRPRAKAWLATAQELVSVHLLGITRGDAVHAVDPDELLAHLLGLGLAVRSVDLAHAQVHPHLALVADRWPGR